MALAQAVSLVKRRRPSLAWSRRPTGERWASGALVSPEKTVGRPFSSEAVVTRPRGLLKMR